MTLLKLNILVGFKLETCEFSNENSYCNCVMQLHISSFNGCDWEC